MAKTKKTLHISLRNALLAIINNISVFAKLWTIFTEILEHQYFETITLHRSVTRQAWINVFLTTQLASADHPLYLDIQTFFFLLVFVEYSRLNLISQNKEINDILYSKRNLFAAVFVFWMIIRYSGGKRLYFFYHFYFLALVCVC